MAHRGGGGDFNIGRVPGVPAPRVVEDDRLWQACILTAGQTVAVPATGIEGASGEYHNDDMNRGPGLVDPLGQRLRMVIEFPHTANTRTAMPPQRFAVISLRRLRERQGVPGPESLFVARFNHLSEADRPHPEQVLSLSEPRILGDDIARRGLARVAVELLRGQNRSSVVVKALRRDNPVEVYTLIPTTDGRPKTRRWRGKTSWRMEWAVAAGKLDEATGNMRNAQNGDTDTDLPPAWR